MSDNDDLIQKIIDVIFNNANDDGLIVQSILRHLYYRGYIGYDDDEGVFIKEAHNE